MSVYIHYVVEYKIPVNVSSLSNRPPPPPLLMIKENRGRRIENPRSYSADSLIEVSLD